MKAVDSCWQLFTAVENCYTLLIPLTSEISTELDYFGLSLKVTACNSCWLLWQLFRTVWQCYSCAKFKLYQRGWETKWQLLAAAKQCYFHLYPKVDGWLKFQLYWMIQNLVTEWQFFIAVDSWKQIIKADGSCHQLLDSDIFIYIPKLIVVPNFIWIGWLRIHIQSDNCWQRMTAFICVPNL